MELLHQWESFYVIVGAAAGGLIGLQFVVLTLIAADPPVRGAEAGAAFATPTIVHFGSALLVSALLAVPWHSFLPLAVLSTIIGVSGFFYALIVVRRMKKQKAYQPEFEDWLFHFLLPFVAYAVLAISGFSVRSHEQTALYGFGTSAVLLLFIGIHNAWDSIAYHVFVHMQKSKEEKNKHY